jgi:hypothetical protein
MLIFLAMKIFKLIKNKYIINLSRFRLIFVIVFLKTSHQGSWVQPFLRFSIFSLGKINLVPKYKQNRDYIECSSAVGELCRPPQLSLKKIWRITEIFLPRLINDILCCRKKSNLSKNVQIWHYHTRCFLRVNRKHFNFYDGLKQILVSRFLYFGRRTAVNRYIITEQHCKICSRAI